jgi:hypothetical protein
LVVVTVAVNVSLSLYCCGLFESVSVEVVVALFTVCVSAAEVLAAKLPVGLYTAVIERVPALTKVVFSDALPALKVAIPSDAAPSKNSTLPVGVPEPLLTEAVNVTACPYVDGFREDTGVLVVVGVPPRTLIFTSLDAVL